MYLIQTDQGATLFAFTTAQSREAKLVQLRSRYPRTIYITKET